MISVDFCFEQRRDLIDFVVALSALISKIDRFFFKITNPHLVSRILSRNRVSQIAKKQGLSVNALFIIAFFNTAVEYSNN